MGLAIHWYDAACFAIVAVAVVGSLWLLVSGEEGCRGRWGRAGWRRVVTASAEYESLLELGAGSGSDPGSNSRRVLRHTQLWTSCWKCVRPAWLLALRLVILACLVALLWWDVVEYDLLIFVYYTEWTFGLVIVYFTLATLISARGCWSHLRQARDHARRTDGGPIIPESNLKAHVSTEEPDQGQVDGAHRLLAKSCDDADEEAGFWGYAMQIIYQASAGAAMLTDLVFWVIIVPLLSYQRFSLNLLMGCMHTVNLLFLLLDTAFNCLPFPVFRMAYFVLWSCAYVVFQWILHACGFSWWPYPFLELSTPYAPLWYCFMALIHIPCYCFYFLVVKAKDKLLSGLFPQAYTGSC